MQRLLGTAKTIKLQEHLTTNYQPRKVTVILTSHDIKWSWVDDERIHLWRFALDVAIVTDFWHALVHKPQFRLLTWQKNGCSMISLAVSQRFKLLLWRCCMAITGHSIDWQSKRDYLRWRSWMVALIFWKEVIVWRNVDDWVGWVVRPEPDCAELELSRQYNSEI